MAWCAVQNVVLGVGKILRIWIPVGNNCVGLQLGAEVNDIDVLQLRGIGIEGAGLNTDVLDEFVLNEAEAGIDVHVVAVPELVQLDDPVEGLLGRCLVVVDRLVMNHAPFARGGSYWVTTILVPVPLPFQSMPITWRFDGSWIRVLRL